MVAAHSRTDPHVVVVLPVLPSRKPTHLKRETRLAHLFGSCFLALSKFLDRVSAVSPHVSKGEHGDVPNKPILRCELTIETKRFGPQNPSKVSFARVGVLPGFTWNLSLDICLFSAGVLQMEAFIPEDASLEAEVGHRHVYTVVVSIVFPRGFVQRARSNCF